MAHVLGFCCDTYSTIGMHCLHHISIGMLGGLGCMLFIKLNTPVNVKPHLPQVEQREGISRGFLPKIVPRVEAFAKT